MVDWIGLLIFGAFVAWAWVCFKDSCANGIHEPDEHTVCWSLAGRHAIAFTCKRCGAHAEYPNKWVNLVGGNTMGKPNFIDAAAAWRSMRKDYVDGSRYLYSISVLGGYFLADKPPIEPPAKPTNSRPCDGGGIQPHGGDEYRCYWCNMVWSRDEERPPCPRG